VALALGVNGLPTDQAPPAARFVLLGVAAASKGTTATLIAVDGKPAQTFRVDSALTDQFFSVGKRPTSCFG
jgi:hypothetical protein